MWALSRRGDKMFLHQPDEGLAVPVILNFGARSMRVGVPSVDELARDYAVYEQLDDAVRAAGPGRSQLINAAKRFSREYSKQFAAQISAGDTTVATLRTLVNGHLSRVLGQQEPSLARSAQADIEVAEFRQALTAG